MGPSPGSEDREPIPEELVARDPVATSARLINPPNPGKDDPAGIDSHGGDNASHTRHPSKVVNDVSQQPSIAHQAQTISILMLSAIWGLLTRLGITAIGNFNGQSVFSLLLVQVVGCIVMGTSVALQPRFNKIHSLLYFGMTTGYCGSVTTFSSWMLQVFQAFSNTSRFSRGRFSDFLDGLNETYVTVGLCLFALQTGLVFGSCMDNVVPSIARRNPLISVSTRISRSASYWTLKKTPSMVIIMVMGPLTWLGSLFLFVWGPVRWRGPVSYSIVIAPTGTILRYYLAKLNQRPLSINHGFPTGTYLANVIATALLALFSALQYSSAARAHPEYCAGLQGLRDGFCGCLSTISTFFLELHRAGSNRNTFRYALVSWLSGQLLCLLLFGIYFWIRDPQEHCHFPQ